MAPAHPEPDAPLAPAAPPRPGRQSHDCRPRCLEAGYFTSLGIEASAPEFVGAAGLMSVLEGPPESVPGGDTVLASVTFLMVTVLRFQVLLG
jgi:hypothetical protein